MLIMITMTKPIFITATQTKVAVKLGNGSSAWHRLLRIPDTITCNISYRLILETYNAHILMPIMEIAELDDAVDKLCWYSICLSPRPRLEPEPGSKLDSGWKRGSKGDGGREDCLNLG
ncbi:hypothetical protein EVAR_3450_1 [Eumeta japonica]|uniref:Uncharacterized protein n=1 Tax=Eumeta variegata TaxID=151549 RepID=A0A4C1SVR2_EUMVA|nr:hypothetical protein EVAR_3450_1 [Eumeta japonica]